jgi:hypothetical protein
MQALQNPPFCSSASGAKKSLAFLVFDKLFEGKIKFLSKLERTKTKVARDETQSHTLDSSRFFNPRLEKKYSLHGSFVVKVRCRKMDAFFCLDGTAVSCT